MEFAGAVVYPNGRITMSWPEGQRAQKETGRRASTLTNKTANSDSNSKNR
jgi:hypothetical protein